MVDPRFPNMPLDWWTDPDPEIEHEETEEFG